MKTEYDKLYNWFQDRPHFPFPENLISYAKFTAFNDSYKGDKSDTRAYNLALCFNADAYKQLNEIKLH